MEAAGTEVTIAVERAWNAGAALSVIAAGFGLVVGVVGLCERPAASWLLAPTGAFAPTEHAANFACHSARPVVSAFRAFVQFAIPVGEFHNTRSIIRSVASPFLYISKIPSIQLQSAGVAETEFAVLDGDIELFVVDTRFAGTAAANACRQGVRVRTSLCSFAVNTLSDFSCSSFVVANSDTEWDIMNKSK